MAPAAVEEVAAAAAVRTTTSGGPGVPRPSARGPAVAEWPTRRASATI